MAEDDGFEDGLGHVEISRHFLFVVGVFVRMRLDIAVHFPLDGRVHALDGDGLGRGGGLEQAHRRTRNPRRVREAQTHLRGRRRRRRRMMG